MKEKIKSKKYKLTKQANNTALKRIARNVFRLNLKFFHLSASVSKPFLRSKIFRVKDAIRITQLTQDMVFY